MPITNNVPGASTQRRYYDSFFIQLETYIRLSTYLRCLNALSESAGYYAFTSNCFWRIYVTISSKLLRTLNYSLFCMEKPTDHLLKQFKSLRYSLYNSISVSQRRRNMSIEYYEFFRSKVILLVSHTYFVFISLVRR